MSNFWIVFFAVSGIVAIAVLAILAIAWPVELLWNELGPALFGLKVISYKQALQLTILCNILFKSMNYNWASSKK